MFRYVSVKHNFSNSSHGSLPDVLDNLYLDTTICPRWPQYFSFECREVRERRVVNVSCVRSVFVSHSTEWLVLMLSRSIGCLVWVVWSASRLLLVMLSLKLVYLLRRGVSWLTLVWWVTFVYSLRMGWVVYFLIGPMNQTWFILLLRMLGIYNIVIQPIACWSYLSWVILINLEVVISR